MKKFNHLAKKKYLKIFLSTIKTKVAIKFHKKKKKKKKKKKNLPKIGLELKRLSGISQHYEHVETELPHNR